MQLGQKAPEPLSGQEEIDALVTAVVDRIDPAA